MGRFSRLDSLGSFDGAQLDDDGRRRDRAHNFVTKCVPVYMML